MSKVSMLAAFICILYCNVATYAEMVTFDQREVTSQAFSSSLSFWAVDVATDGKYLYLLDGENHRILAFFGTTVIRTIGGIGNGPGEFYYPTKIVARRGRIVVSDGGNHRLQILNSDGHYLNAISVGKVWGVANFLDNVYVGNPARSRLVDVYDISGRELGSIGEIIAPDQIFGDPIGDHQDSHSMAINRIHLAVDNEGFLWVAFQHLPLVRKYASSGELLFERRLNFSGIDVLERAVRDLGAKSVGVPSMNIDGVQLTIIIRDIEYDHASDVAIILLADGRMAGFNNAGEVIYLTPSLELESSVLAVSPNSDSRSLVLCLYGNPPQVMENFWKLRQR